jgi:hypothetical protein
MLKSLQYNSDLMQLSIRLVVYPVHMANRKSLGLILVHDARGKLAVRRTRMNTFFLWCSGPESRLRGWRSFPTSGFAKKILSVVDEPASVSDCVACSSSGFSRLEWNVLRCQIKRKP